MQSLFLTPRSIGRAAPPPSVAWRDSVVLILSVAALIVGWAIAWQVIQTAAADLPIPTGIGVSFLLMGIAVGALLAAQQARNSSLGRLETVFVGLLAVLFQLAPVAVGIAVEAAASAGFSKSLMATLAAPFLVMAASLFALTMTLLGGLTIVSCTINDQGRLDEGRWVLLLCGLVALLFPRLLADLPSSPLLGIVAAGYFVLLLTSRAAEHHALAYPVAALQPPGRRRFLYAAAAGIGGCCAFLLGTGASAANGSWVWLPAVATVPLFVIAWVSKSARADHVLFALITLLAGTAVALASAALLSGSHYEISPVGISILAASVAGLLTLSLSAAPEDALWKGTAIAGFILLGLGIGTGLMAIISWSDHVTSLVPMVGIGGLPLMALIIVQAFAPAVHRQRLTIALVMLILLLSATALVSSSG